MVRCKSIYELAMKISTDKSMADDIKEYMIQIQKPWEFSISQNSDRSTSIISGCLLDILLEKLIRSYFIKDRKVKDLFSNDHILQSFYSKIQISYFSGLIAQPIYNDLTNICKIRNKFAHDVSANLDFDDTSISQIIDNCKLKPKDPKITLNKTKYIIIVQQIMDHICWMEQLLSRQQLVYPIEYLDFDKLPYGEMAVSFEQIQKHKTLRKNK